MKLRIGTRGSDLALAQARDVSRRLQEKGHSTEIIIIQTIGDQKTDRPFAAVGAPGIFVREIETALQEERIDVAVHSYKDLTSWMPDDLVIAAVPERVSPTDRLLYCPEVYNPSMGLIPLKEGSTVGTASARRRALLKHFRPDLKVKSLRGNVPTRVGKLLTEDYDAILLASAGLDRLERIGMKLVDKNLIKTLDLDPTQFVPAPSQGALALQVKETRPQVLSAVQNIDDQKAHHTVRGERALQALIEGGCQLPFGAYCTDAAEGQLTMLGFLFADEQAQFASVTGDTAQDVARQLWDQLNQWGDAPPWQAK